MRLLRLFCLAGAIAAASDADTMVYFNVSQPGIGADGVSFIGPLYDSFTSGAATRLTSLKLILSGDDTSSGAVQVGLYADHSTAPGNLIAVLGSVKDSSLSETPGLYAIPLTAYPGLTDDTVYWIGLSGTTSAEWYYDDDTSGTGVEGEFFSNQTGVYADDFGPYQMEITEGLAAAPEPSTGLLTALGAGLVAVGWRRRRGKGRADNGN
jgi:hypothetical protein